MRIAIEDRSQGSFRREVVNRSRDAPFEGESDWGNQVREDAQRMRVLIGVFGRILFIGIGVLRTRQVWSAHDQGGKKANNRSPHGSTFLRYVAMCQLRL